MTAKVHIAVVLVGRHRVNRGHLREGRFKYEVSISLIKVDDTALSSILADHVHLGVVSVVRCQESGLVVVQSWVLLKLNIGEVLELEIPVYRCTKFCFVHAKHEHLVVSDEACVIVWLIVAKV